MSQQSPEGRQRIIDAALADYDDGHYMEELRRRVAIPTESQNPDRLPELYRYLEAEIGPAFERMGYAWRIYDNPFEGKGPVLLAERIDGASIAVQRDDHFLLLLAETEVDGARQAAERLRQEFGKELGLELRYGVASFPQEESTLEGLLETAEHEMRRNESWLKRSSVRQEA